MSRRKSDPLREMSSAEQHYLAQLSRSQTAPAVEVTRAKILLAVARGDDYQAAALSVGRRSTRRRLSTRRPLQCRGPGGADAPARRRPVTRL